MDPVLPYIIYLGVYRTAIVGAGVLFVFLGYRLFLRGVWPGGTTDLDADISAKRLTLRNAAPGTIFALFGASLVVAMILTGNPGATFDFASGVGERRTIGFRSEDAAPVQYGDYKNQSIDALIQQAQAYLNQGDTERASDIYEYLVDRTAVALNNLSALELERCTNIPRALILATAAAELFPRNADYADTLATAKRLSGTSCRTQ